MGNRQLYVSHWNLDDTWEHQHLYNTLVKKFALPFSYQFCTLIVYLQEFSPVFSHENFDFTENTEKQMKWRVYTTLIGKFQSLVIIHYVKKYTATAPLLYHRHMYVVQSSLPCHVMCGVVFPDEIDSCWQGSVDSPADNPHPLTDVPFHLIYSTNIFSRWS